MKVLHVVPFLILIGSQAALAEPRIKVCNDMAGWPPYTFADETALQGVGGASTKILRQVLSDLGNSQDEVEFKLLPWRRCLTEVFSGKRTMLYDASSNPERRENTYLTLTLQKTVVETSL